MWSGKSELQNLGISLHKNNFSRIPRCLLATMGPHKFLNLVSSPHKYNLSFPTFLRVRNISSFSWKQVEMRMVTGVMPADVTIGLMTLWGGGKCGILQYLRDQASGRGIVLPEEEVVGYPRMLLYYSPVSLYFLVAPLPHVLAKWLSLV